MGCNILCIVQMLCYVFTFAYANVEYSSIENVYIVEVKIKLSSSNDDQVFTTLNQNIPNLTYAKPLSSFLKSADPPIPLQCQSTLVCDTEVNYENRFMSSTYDPYTIPCFAWVNKPCSTMSSFAEMHMCSGVSDCLSCCVDDTEPSGLSQNTVTVFSFTFVLCGIVILMCATFIYCFKIKDFVPAKFRIAKTDPMSRNEVKFKLTSLDIFSKDKFNIPIPLSLPNISIENRLYTTNTNQFQNTTNKSSEEIDSVSSRKIRIDNDTNPIHTRFDGKELLKNIKRKFYNVYDYFNGALLKIDDKINRAIKSRVEKHTNLKVSNGTSDIEKPQKNNDVSIVSYNQSQRKLPKSRAHMKNRL